MAHKEVIKYLTNIKVYVNGKSKEIQEKLFSLNFKWYDGSQKVKKVNCPFLFLRNGRISYNDDMVFFTKCSFREITAEEILAITIDEQQYHPFKNAEECWNEMQKHQPFQWIKHKYCEIMEAIISVDNIEKEVLTSSMAYTFEEAFKQITFVDGSPFGIKED